MSPIDDREEEKPLDPATERIRARMVRLLAVSIGIMAVGLMAVLGGIVYRIAGAPEAADTASPGQAADALAGLPDGFEGRIGLPSGARILSSDLDGGHVLLRIALASGAEELLIYRLASDSVVARIRVE